MRTHSLSSWVEKAKGTWVLHFEEAAAQVCGEFVCSRLSSRCPVSPFPLVYLPSQSTTQPLRHCPRSKTGFTLRQSSPKITPSLTTRVLRRVSSFSEGADPDFTLYLLSPKQPPSPKPPLHPHWDAHKREKAKVERQSLCFEKKYLLLKYSYCKAIFHECIAVQWIA